MSAFTERIYSEFNNEQNLHAVNKHGAVLPEDRWSCDNVRPPSLLDLLTQDFDFENIRLNNSYNDESKGESLKRYSRIFDDKLKLDKKAVSASSSLQQDLSALKYLDFSSPEKNLQTLLSLNRQSVKRAVIQSSLTRGQTKTRLKLLLLYLAETNFDNTHIISKVEKQELSSYFSEDALPYQATLQKVKSDLLVLQTSATVSQLENYLNESADCQLLYHQVPKTSVALDQMQLDLVCRQISESLLSPQVLVRFASLTGNVTYLIKAIHKLLKDSNQYLFEDQVTCPSIRCEAKLSKSNHLLKNQVLVKKQELPFQLADQSTRLLKFYSQQLQIYVDAEKSSLEVYRGDTQIFSLQIQAIAEQFSKESLQKICISPFVSKESKDYDASYRFFLIVQQLFDQNRGKLETQLRLLDVEKKVINDGTLVFSNLASKLQEIAQTERSYIDFVKIWKNRRDDLMTLVVTQRYDSEGNTMPQEQWRSKILTLEILSVRCIWSQQLDGFVEGIQILEQQKSAAVLISTGGKSELQFCYLFSGSLSLAFNVGKGATFKVPILPFNTTQEFGKDLPKNQSLKQNQINGQWWWVQGNQKLVFSLVDGVCQWSNGVIGSYEFDSQTQMLIINKDDIQIKYLLSDDSYSLTLQSTDEQTAENEVDDNQDEERYNERVRSQGLRGREAIIRERYNRMRQRRRNRNIYMKKLSNSKSWPVKCLRCVYVEDARELQTFLDMKQFILSKNKAKISAQFGGNPGRTCQNLIIPSTTNDNNKWQVADVPDGQSWVLIEFGSEIDLDGIGFTATDFPDNQPEFVEVHYQQPAGLWIYIGAQKLQFTAMKENIFFGFQRNIRSTAMIFNFGKYPPFEKLPIELQLGQIKLLQDPRRFQLNCEQGAQSEFSIQPKFSTFSNFATTTSVCNLKGELVFDIKDPVYPLQSVPEDVSKSKIERQVSQYFQLQKLDSPHSSLASWEWAFYLAKLVNHHTSVHAEDKIKNLKVRWLHKQPTKQYFEAVYELFTDEEVDINILEHLHMNVADNLNVFSQFIDSGLDTLLGQDRFAKLLICHSTMRPKILNYYRKACERQEPSLEDFASHFKGISPKVSSELKYKTTCESLLNDGDLSTFIELWNELAHLQQVQKLCGLILTIGNAIDRLDLQVPVDIIRFLISQCNTAHKSLQLKRDIQHVVLKVVSQQFLKHVNRSKHTKYDHKGYLVTQSELLSGGVNEMYISIFSEETHQLLQVCADLTRDEHLQEIIAKSKRAKAEQQSQSTIETQSHVLDKNIFYYLIHRGQDQLVDEIINVFQRSLVKRGGLIARQCQVGLDLGMRLVRAAFASIVKLQSKASEQFENLKNDIDLMNGEDIPLEKGQERDDAIFDICSRSPDYQNLLKLWISATKMRNWLTAKIQSVSQKYQKKNIDDGDKQEEDHMQKIYQNIVEKAELLIKIDPPKQQVKAQIQIDQLKRTPSYIPPKFATIKTDQHLPNQHQEMIQTDQDSQDACVASVLSCLQSPVLAIEIQNQIEINYLEAVKRLTGFTLVSQMLSEDVVGTAIEVVNILSMLQKKDGKLSHYLDGISGGCNLSLEAKIRRVFFDILQSLANLLVKTKDHEEAFTLVYSFQWAYHARDFDQLLRKIDIFSTLTKGEPNSLVSQSWCKFMPKFPTLSSDLLLSFKDIFMTILSRVSDPAEENQTQLKTFGNENLLQAVPKLVKVRSYLDENSSSLLIDSALRAIFKVFGTFIANKQKLDQLSLDSQTVIEIQESKNDIELEQEVDFLGEKILKVIGNLNGTEVKNEDSGSQELFLANIEVQIDTNRQETEKSSKKVGQQVIAQDTELSEKLQNAKNKMITTFVTISENGHLDHLLECVKVLSSVSRQSSNAAKILKSVASPYYVRTLLQLVSVLSIQTKFRVLKILEDLICIDPSLVRYQDDLSDQQLQIYDSYIANFLHNFARECLQKQDQIVVLKQVVRLLRKLDIKEVHAQRILNLKNLDETEQILSLMICDCGAELRSFQLGDAVKLASQKEPVSETFYIIQIQNQKCELYSADTGHTLTQDRQYLVPVIDETPICYPDETLVRDMIIAQDTIPIVKTALLNLVLRNQERYTPILDEISAYIQHYIVADYLQQREREDQQSGYQTSNFLADHLEDRVFQNADKELLAEPVKLPSQKQNSEQIPLIRRTLTRSFYRPKKQKQPKYANTVQESAYYDLFQVRDTLYHLIENPILKNDYLTSLQTSKSKLPLEYEQYKKEFIKDRVVRVRRIMECWGDQQKVKQFIQNSEVLEYTKKFNYNFSYILKHEVQTENQPKQKKLVIKKPLCENLLFQRMSELLFNIYSQQMETINDDEVLWHLNRFYMNKSTYLYHIHQTARNLTKRWFEIVNASNPQWIKRYIKRALRHGYGDSEVRWDDEGEENYFYLVNRPIRIVFKLIESRYEEFSGFIPSFCEITFRHMVAIRSSNDQLFALTRKHLRMIETLLTIMHQRKDLQTLKLLLDGTMLKEFLIQACQTKSMYQFSYVGRTMYQQIGKIIKDLDVSGQLGLQNQINSKLEDKFLPLMIDYQNIVQDKRIDLLSIMSLVKQKPVLDNASEIKSQHFGQWQQIKIEQPDSTFQYATIQLAALQGSGFALAAISDEPEINNNTLYRVVQAGGEPDVITFQVDAKKAAYLLYPVNSNFLQKYSYFRPDQNFFNTNPAFFDSQNCKIFGFQSNYKRNQSWLFVSSDKGLFLGDSGTVFEEVKGLQGKVESVVQLSFKEVESFAIITDQQGIYLLNVKKPNQKKTEQRSFYRKSKKEEKIQIQVSFLQQKDEITTFRAVTNDNETLTLVALTVFEDDVSLTVLKDDKEIATLACRWTNNKRQGLKGENVYIELEKKQDNLKAKRVFKKEKFYKPEQQIDYLSMISNQDEMVFCTVVDRNLDFFSVEEGSEVPKIRCKLPQEVTKVLKVHCAFSDENNIIKENQFAFFIEAQIEVSSEVTLVILYWGLYNLSSTDEQGVVQFSLKQATHQNFKTIYSAQGRIFAIDQEGELWTFFDFRRQFIPQSEKEAEDLDERLHQIKTTMMRQRMSKAVEVFLTNFSYDKQDPQCPSEDDSLVLLFVKRTRELVQDKTEESFVVIPERNVDSDYLSTSLAFNLTQIYYRENKYIQQSDYKTMVIIQESMNMATQFFLVKPNIQNVTSLKYRVLDPNSVDSSFYDFGAEELQACKAYLNTELKQTKLKDLQKGVLLKKRPLKNYLQTAQANKEGHSQSLIQLLLTANQFILDSLPITRARAHDYKYSHMQDYINFAEKYALPMVLQMITLLIQKTIKADEKYHNRTVRFQRLNPTEKLFDQLYRQTSAQSKKVYTYLLDPERPFRSRFIGENAYDAGGPFRDVMDDICAEITESFFKPTNNMAITGESSYQPQLLLDPLSSAKYKYIGNMIGWSLRQWKYNLSLDINPLFWKRILQQTITIEHLKEVDKHRYQMLLEVLQNKYSCTFEADLGTGQEVLLCENGQDVVVSPENSQEFVRLYLMKYLEQDQKIHDAIRIGVQEVCPQQILRHLTVQIASDVAFSSPKVSAEEILNRIKHDDSILPTTLDLFKRMIREFSNKERQLLLKFVTGSSRLTNSGNVIYINDGGDHDGDDHLDDFYEHPERNPDHQKYPVGHTCGKSVDLPNYTDYNIMCARFRTAILTCGEIDDDGNYYDSEDNNEEGGNSSRGEGGEGEDSSNSEEGEGESEGSDQGESDDSQEQSQLSVSHQNSRQSDSWNSNSDGRQSRQFYGSLGFNDDDSYSEGEGAESENSSSEDDSDRQERRRDRRRRRFSRSYSRSVSRSHYSESDGSNSQSDPSDRNSEHSHSSNSHNSEDYGSDQSDEIEGSQSDSSDKNSVGSQSKSQENSDQEVEDHSDDQGKDQSWESEGSEQEVDY